MANQQLLNRFEELTFQLNSEYKNMSQEELAAMKSELDNLQDQIGVLSSEDKDKDKAKELINRYNTVGKEAFGRLPEGGSVEGQHSMPGSTDIAAPDEGQKYKEMGTISVASYSPEAAEFLKEYGITYLPSNKEYDTPREREARKIAYEYAAGRVNEGMKERFTSRLKEAKEEERVSGTYLDEAGEPFEGSRKNAQYILDNPEDYTQKQVEDAKNTLSSPQGGYESAMKDRLSKAKKDTKGVLDEIDEYYEGAEEVGRDTKSRKKARDILDNPEDYTQKQIEDAKNTLAEEGTVLTESDRRRIESETKGESGKSLSKRRKKDGVSYIPDKSVPDTPEMQKKYQAAKKILPGLRYKTFLINPSKWQNVAQAKQAKAQAKAQAKPQPQAKPLKQQPKPQAKADKKEDSESPASSRFMTMLTDMQDRFDSERAAANKANQLRFTQGLAEISKLGGAERLRINRQGRREKATVEQSLKNRGLGQSTVIGPMRRRIQESMDLSNMDLGERLAKLKMNWIGSREDVGPNSGLYMQVAKMMGEASGAFKT